ncbi:MAG: hypothetical protein HZC28_14835 [Spirochaetes bacterium]|nr:hypothetical protein [Spirochaetota bacterium]
MRKSNAMSFETITNIITDVGLTILRGPTGSEGNYIAWKEGGYIDTNSIRFFKYVSKDGALLNDAESEQMRMPPELREKLGAAAVPSVLKRQIESYAAIGGAVKVYPKDVYRIPSALNIPYVFNANIASQDVEEIVWMAAEIKAVTRHPIYIELGNELYEPGYKQQFPTAREYAQKARVIYQKVKAVDPSIKIGVVLSQNYTSEKYLVSSGVRTVAKGLRPESPIRRYNDWNGIIAEYTDSFDAIIIHPYDMPPRPLLEQTPESLMTWMMARNEVFDEVMRTDFPKQFPGKEIWLTEYGILPEEMFGNPDESVKARMQFLKSPGASVVNMDLILRWMQNPVITITAKHTLFDRQGFGIVQMGGTNSDEIIKLPDYYIFQALGRLIKNNNVIYRISMAGISTNSIHQEWNHISQAKEIVDIQLGTAGAFGLGDAQGVTKIIFINRVNAPQTVTVKDHKLRPFWCYGGSVPFPNYQSNHSKGWRAPPDVLPVPEKIIADFSAGIKLQPYSATIADCMYSAK